MKVEDIRPLVGKIIHSVAVKRKYGDFVRFLEDEGLIGCFQIHCDDDGYQLQIFGDTDHLEGTPITDTESYGLILEGEEILIYIVETERGAVTFKFSRDISDEA